MCVIISCPKGFDKNDEFLYEAIRTAAVFNGDGMGYIIKRASDNSLFINKGFFEVNDFIESIKNESVGMEDELHLHLRIGNKGEISKKMCHPFIISNDEEEISEFLKGNANKPALMHNGTMHSFSEKGSSNSDTFFFTRDLMSNKSLLNLSIEDPAIFKKLIEPHISLSRLLLVYPGETETLYVGEWFHHKGLTFSKDYVKEYTTINRAKRIDLTGRGSESNWGRGNINRCYDDWYDCYDDYGYDIYHARGNVVSMDKKPKEDYDFSRFTFTDSPVAVPDLDYKRHSVKTRFNVEYVLYMGLYLPKEPDFDDYIVKIDNFNLSDVEVTAMFSDYEIGIYKYKEYIVSGCSNSKIWVQEIATGDEYSVPVDKFYNIFEVNVTGFSSGFYPEYFDLLTKIPVSKNNYKKIKKALGIKYDSLDEIDDIDNGIGGDINISFNKKKYSFSKSVLLMWILQAEEELEMRKETLFN